jgi:acetyltransferase-like isoleucine patch superfamily enzyme
MENDEFRDVIHTPWKIWNEVFRYLELPLVRLNFLLAGIHWKGGSYYGLPIIQRHRLSVMLFGKDMSLRSSVRSNPLGPNHPVILCTWKPGAELKIGDHFGMTGGSIIVAEKVVIGNNVFVGANTTITDTDFHPLNPQARMNTPQKAKTSPIIIEDNVFIGMNCLILKGVTIGKGSIIGAGSVVTKNIPENTISAGNPAKPIRKLVFD